MKLKVKLIATSLALTSIISVPVFALTQYGDGSAETTECKNLIKAKAVL